ncbi:MAG: undecaprenyldiphospho-muramoylpentapeptide beta-N-acetylglucosaminyltransferase [Candidatus Melainabacteria bacterium]
MRIAVTGGGTGGHIYPALAVAEALRAEGHTLLYVGNRTHGGQASLESRLAPERGFAFECVSFYGMPRALSLSLLKWLWALRRAREVAREILATFQPDAVLGTGGYVSAPVLLAAQSLKIPTVIHEPDAHPGLANRQAARRATRVTAAFAQSGNLLGLSGSDRFFVTGNPVAAGLGTIPRAEALQTLGWDWPAEGPVLLVTGGSQGARRINEAVVEALPTLRQTTPAVRVIHVSGPKLFEETQTRLASVYPDWAGDPGYRLMAYTADMPLLMAVSTVALCRAGSMTLSEMMVCGLPTVLIPYPHAAADHQTLNARASETTGASLVIPDSALTGERLLSVLLPLLADTPRLAAMAQAARAQAHPEATAAIAGHVLAAARG